MSAGLSRPTADGFDGVTTFTTDRLAANYWDTIDDEFRTDYRLQNVKAFDIGGGLLIGSRLSVGVALARHADEQPANLTITLRHPEYHPPLIATTASRPLKRTDTAAHLSIGYVVPMGDASVRLFAGPSRFSVSHELLAFPSFEERATYVPVPPFVIFSLSSISAIEVETARSTAWGYHAGADVSYFFTRHVGVGGLARYSDATVRFQNPLASRSATGYFVPFYRTESVELDAGRVDVFAGLRLRF